MISEKLFEEVLINPCEKKGYDELLVLSGYGTPSFADYHLTTLENKIGLTLIVGMAPRGAVSQIQHKNFLELNNKNDKFKCFYVANENPPVHAKTYIWLKDSVPQEAFCGSVNYSMNGFKSKQIEAITNCDAGIAMKLFKQIHNQSVSCLDTGELIFPTKDVEPAVKFDANKVLQASMTPQYVELPLYVTKDNTMHQKSGLNWGQRGGREPNQAYIPVPSYIRDADFFPPRGQHFSVLTTDGQAMICTIAQQGDKAIETPSNNSILGIYFREKLGVPLGEFVEFGDLERYGKDHVKFIKLGDEEYLMDF